MLVAVANLASPQSNGYKVIKHFCATLEAHIHLDVVTYQFRGIRKIIDCHLLIAHTPLHKAVPLLLLAKLFRKKTVALIWDYYPVRIFGRPYRHNVLIIVRDWLEHFGYYLVDEMVVPTHDFYSVSRLRSAVCLPYWAEPSILPTKNTHDRQGQRPLILAFAGQINQTRGLCDAILEIDKRLRSPAILRIFSRDQFDSPLGLQYLRVEYKGYIQGDGLKRELRRCDCGLISLSPGFDGPGLPSKVFDYLSVGIPVIYSGPCLSEFVSTLERTKCGHDISNIEYLTLNRLFSDSFPFYESRAAFFKKFCLDAEAFALWLRERFGDDAS